MRLVPLSFVASLLTTSALAQGVLPSPQANLSASTVTTGATGSLARTLAAMGADVFNVMSFTGADATGAGSSDNSVPINAASAAARNGTLATVYLPAGRYHVKNPITAIGSTTQSQCIVGDGDATIIDVDSDFNTSAPGVIELTGGNGSSGIEPCVRNLQVVFHQPLDIVTTTTAGQTAGNNTITVASAAGIVNGMAVVDLTATGAIPSPVYGTSATVPTVTNVSGTTITLSANVASPGVGSGDTIHFASARSQFKTLAAGCTTTSGGSGCKYPWAIYSNGATTSAYIDHVTVSSAWDGVYIRGQTFHIGTLFVGAFDKGLDIDNCHNFPQMADYVFWAFGFADNPQKALISSFYDGTTIAANLGAVDGGAFGHFQTWAGIVNLTAAWAWGSFDSLMLDGNGSNLNILSTDATGRLQIGSLYSTKGGANGAVPISQNADAGFVTTINSLYINTQYTSSYTVDLEGGSLSIAGGTVNRTAASAAAVFQEGSGATALNLSNMHMIGPSNTVGGYVLQAGGTARIVNNSWDTTPGTTPTAVSLTDNALNNVTGNSFNGWGFQAPGPLGNYNPNTGNGMGGWISYTPGVFVWVSGTLTAASATGSYYKLGQRVCLNNNITITTAGTANSIRSDLPTTSVTGMSEYTFGYSSQGSIVGQTVSNSNQVFILGPTGVAFVPSNGNHVFLNGCYQTQ